MGLFAGPAAQMTRIFTEPGVRDRLRVVPPLPGWPRANDVVLGEDVAIELGNPQDGSLFFLHWDNADDLSADRLRLLGPEIREIQSRRLAFALALRVAGSFADEYVTHCALKNAVYDTRLQGLSIRMLPSRQSIWCRLDQQARNHGFSLAHLGAALCDSLHAVAGVRAVEVTMIIGDKPLVQRLSRPAADIARIGGALLKMNEEMDLDCEHCAYWDVCEAVAELKRICARLQKERRA